MIRCTTKKESFKNLTLDKEYDGTEDGDYYVVTNDAGKPSKYAKKYFTTVVVAPRSTFLVDAINIEIDGSEDADDLQPEATILIGRHRPVTVHLNIENTSISCGIVELSEIRLVKEECTALYNRIDHALYTGTKEDLFRAVFTRMLDSVKENMTGCYIMSDNINRNGEQGYNDIITELSTMHYECLNNNSGNQIMLWVFGG